MLKDDQIVQLVFGEMGKGVQEFFQLWWFWKIKFDMKRMYILGALSIVIYPKSDKFFESGQQRKYIMLAMKTACDAVMPV